MNQLVKIRRHHCKKGLKTWKGPEFDGDLWENNNDITLQSRKVLLDPTIQTSLKFEVSWFTSNVSLSNLASLLTKF